MLEKIIKFGIFLSLFTPLIVSKGTFFPFIFGKAIFFQVLIEILLVFWLILLFQGKINLRWTKLNLALLIYFLILILATFFGVDPIRSFWSTQERMTGTFNLLHFLGFFFIINSCLKTKKDQLLLLQISLLASFCVSGFSLLNWDKKSQLSGPLGNPGFLAVFLLFNIFFAFYLIMKDKNKFLRAIYILITILNLVAFYFTKTYGAFAGLLFGIVTFLLSQIFFFSGKRRQLALFFLIVLLISCTYLFFSQRFFQRIETKIRDRQISWGVSWNAFLERPLFGWGPENYIYAWTKHFNPQYKGGFWFDKAHCQPLEILVTTGIFGFLSYLSIFFVAILNFFRKRNFTFLSLLVAYFVTNLFWFDTTSSLIPLFITLTLSQNQNQKSKIKDQR